MRTFFRSLPGAKQDEYLTEVNAFIQCRNAGQCESFDPANADQERANEIILSASLIDNFDRGNQKATAEAMREAWMHSVTVPGHCNATTGWRSPLDDAQANGMLRDCFLMGAFSRPQAIPLYAQERWEASKCVAAMWDGVGKVVAGHSPLVDATLRMNGDVEAKAKVAVGVFIAPVCGRMAIATLGQGFGKSGAVSNGLTGALEKVYHLANYEPSNAYCLQPATATSQSFYTCWERAVTKWVKAAAPRECSPDYHCPDSPSEFPVAKDPCCTLANDESLSAGVCAPGFECIRHDSNSSGVCAAKLEICPADPRDFPRTGMTCCLQNEEKKCMQGLKCGHDSHCMEKGAVDLAEEFVSFDDYDEYDDWDDSELFYTTPKPDSAFGAGFSFVLFAVLRAL
mmetsp:Transcript_44038/g.99149  ORF Transcript_44038/g.99149 Transcript_44038/m.99149 type:complete len:398 (+) Transcript_44038:4-1197(+)